MKSLLLVTAAVGIYLSVDCSASYAQAGSLDITFNPGSAEKQPSTYCMVLQTNGQIVIGGAFTSFNGANAVYLTRLNADGSVDTSFGPTAPGGYLNTLALQPDGKILVGGNFSQVNGVLLSGVARLRTNGSVDIAFMTADPFGAALALCLQSDGKLLVAGNPMGRLTTNGTQDVTFNPGAGIANGYVDAIGLQSNGQIIVGGNFTALNGGTRNYLARLNADGSVDTNFDAGIGLGSKVVCVAVLPQDKILIGGIFSSVSGYSRNNIARLNADGSVDGSFNPGIGTDAPVVCFAAQSDGKIIIGGGFSHVNDTNRVGVARLNIDGSLDLSFNPGTGGNGNIDSVASQPDGKTIIGGEFTKFNGTNISGIARLHGDTSPTTNLQFMASHLYFGTYLSGTVSNTYRVEWTSQFNTPSLWTPLVNVSLQTNPQFILDPNPVGGQRFYRAVQVAP